MRGGDRRRDGDRGPGADRGRVRAASLLPGSGGGTRGGRRREPDPRAAQAGPQRQHPQARAARVRARRREDGEGRCARGGRVLLPRDDAHADRASLRDREDEPERPARDVVGHAGAALSAPRDRPRARPGRRQGACRSARGGWSVRREVGALRSRVLRGASRGAHGPAGEDSLHAGGGLLLPPRPASDEDDLPGGGVPRRPHPGRGREDDPGWGRVRLLRARHDLLQRAAPDGAVRDRLLPLRFHAGLHEQGPVRAQAGTWFRSAALRLRDLARQGGRGAGTGPDRVQAGRLHGDRPHGERVSGAVERVPGVPGVGRDGERVEGQVPEDGLRPRHRRGGILLHLRYQLSDLSQPDAAGGRPGPGGAFGPRDSPPWRVGDRPGLRLDDGIHRLRRARRPPRLRADLLGRYRSRSGRPRSLLLARDRDGGERLRDGLSADRRAGTGQRRE